MTPLRDRPTADLIVLALTALVGAILLMTALAVTIEQLWYPERDTAALAMRVGQIVSSLIAAIVGYLAGRSQNGAHS